MLRRLYSCAVEQIAVSAITVAELQHGAAKSQQPERNRQALMEFLLPFSLLDFDCAAAAAYGVIRADLEVRGAPIGPMDRLLAAQAISRDLVLVTNNTREFARVPGLRTANWVDA